MRPTWDEYFLALAAVVATRADCTRSQVGAVLVNAKHEVRGTGYNGAPAGIPGCASAGACPRGKLSVEECARNTDYANCIADHAERNALRHADPRELFGSTLYTTREPCPSCWTLIRATGLSRVVAPGLDLTLQAVPRHKPTTKGKHDDDDDAPTGHEGSEEPEGWRLGHLRAAGLPGSR
ncbi:deoxycytidylate deaminase [Streptomyces phage TG1]|uniref:Deoxycytidylate deaminase n=1 Tax=Streptomyces phage TG1 TaxID=2927987 RepID=K4I352_9CAUD|nr:dCMP deaminase [Streptomyces phage TG1]AFU62235.1 deoxycytidylate deaminase [Streptomyces phage TG1]